VFLNAEGRKVSAEFAEFFRIIFRYEFVKFCTKVVEDNREC